MSQQPSLITPVYNTGGAYSTRQYNHVSTDITNTYYEYELSPGAGTRTNIAYNWSTQKWFDPHPTDNHNTFGTSSTDVTSSSRESSQNPATIYLMETSGSALVSLFANPYYVSAGPTVTSGRTPRSGSVPLASNFTVRFPTVTKTAAGRIKVQWYDQNEPSTGYNLTTTWQTSSGEYSITSAITVGTGDYYLHWSPTGGTSWEIKNGLIKLQIDTPVYYNGLLYGADAIFKTFTYYETGPITASFSPDFGLPGQTVGFSVTDTNLYPDANTTFQVEQTPGGSLISGTLSSTNNYSISVHPLFTSQHGTYKIYNGSTVLATATYDTNYIAPTTTSNGGGKPDRYPLIMTNLFNRNRSIYSIGMTHKDTWDLFL